MDQTSLFATSEEAAYKRIEPQLLTVLQSNWADPALLRLDRRKNYSSILFGSSVVARLSGGASPTISILKSRTPIPGAAEEGNFYKLPVSDLSEAEGYLPQMQEALQALIDRIPREFSCCSRYQECSEQMACTNPNRELALRCAYRKNLHSGKVFYGRNRNV